MNMRFGVQSGIRSGIGAGLLGAVLASGTVLGAQPNVVLIVADDLGYADAGFTMPYAMPMRTSTHLGQPWDPTPLAEVHTPNIDRLAQQGVVFTSGYVNGNVCSPTRAGLMLGRYQQRTGIYDAGTGGLGMPVYEAASYSQSGNDFARINPIFPEFLRQSASMESNYVAGVFGKWHLGEDEIYELVNGTLINDVGRVRKTGFPYTSIAGGNYEEPDIVAGPIANLQSGQNVDPTWMDGSPWHCLNRGFDHFFYFMGRGAHDFWDPNNVYDDADPAHPFRRTAGMDARLNPGYSGSDADQIEPVGSWDSASAYTIHPARIPENYMTVRIAEAATDFIGQQAASGRPFFCYVPFNAAHSPAQTPYHMDPSTTQLDRLDNTVRRYNVLDESGNPAYPVTDLVEADWSNPKTPPINWFPDPLYLYEKYKDNPAAFRYFSGGSGQQAVKADADIRARCITLAMIRWMDKGIGEIIQKLKDPNGDGDESDSVYDNTVVLFISDNGGASGMLAANAPLRGNKSTNWEGGIRSPFIFSWPAMLKAQNGTQTNDLGEVVANQQLVHAPVIAMDFLPTLLDINGLPPLAPSVLLDEETQHFYDYSPEGSSLMPLIRGEADAIHDYLFWANGAAASDGAVRKGEWKLFLNHGLPLELYNLDDDIAETTNVAESHPDVVRDLRQAYFDFMNQAAESLRLPVPNTRLYMTLSNPPVSVEGQCAIDYFDYPASTKLTTGLDGGTNWVGSWQVSSTGDNALIDPGSLSFNDPAGTYVDDGVGNHFGARRKEIEISRAFSGTPVASPVWFSCLLANMQNLDAGLHQDQQRWQIHPNNLPNTYLKIGEGLTAASSFVANGVSSALDVPVDLTNGTYLLVMRMETDVDGLNDSVRAWIIPAGTAIESATEVALDAAAGGAANLNRTNANLWASGLASIGLLGDGALNSDPDDAAMIDSLRISFAGTNDAVRLNALLKGAIGQSGEPPSALAYYRLAQADVGSLAFQYDEIAGWLTSDASSGALFEMTTNLSSGVWLPTVPAESDLIDWWGDQKSYRVRFGIGPEPAAFIRMR